MLLAAEHPYGSLTRARLGSYWNLVMPYALASGFFRPGGARGAGILDYMQGHGALLLGLVRAGAYALYGRHAPPPLSGTDEVYGTNLERFLADNGQAGEIVLSLYGELADAMTPGTFVSGEAASIAPLAGTRDRAMYLPPNSAANASYLETLRLMLVDERLDARGAPVGLELADAVPRSWLRAGRTIRVRELPTSFGPISFTITAGVHTVRVLLAPTRIRPRSLELELRLPAAERIRRLLARRPSVSPDFDAATGAIDLERATWHRASLYRAQGGPPLTRRDARPRALCGVLRNPFTGACLASPAVLNRPL